MADGGWAAALGGVAAGVIVKGLWDWWLAVGKVRADRDARAEARRDKRQERRDDLQRQTLLDLQEAVVVMAGATAKAHQHDLLAEEAGAEWGATIWPEEIVEEARAAHARLRLLRSRVKNEDLRKVAGEFSLACADQGMAPSRQAATLKYADALKASEQTHDLAGRLIREMDDIP